MFSATNTFANTTATGFRHEIFIGPSGPYQGRAFNGAIDELAVFTNSLSAADMQICAMPRSARADCSPPPSRPLDRSSSVAAFPSSSSPGLVPPTANHAPGDEGWRAHWLSLSHERQLDCELSQRRRCRSGQHLQSSRHQLRRIYHSSPVAITGRASRLLLGSRRESRAGRLLSPQRSQWTIRVRCSHGPRRRGCSAIHTTGPQPPTQAGFESGNAPTPSAPPSTLPAHRCLHRFARHGNYHQPGHDYGLAKASNNNDTLAASTSAGRIRRARMPASTSPITAMVVPTSWIAPGAATIMSLGRLRLWQ